ncbi:hypothetical protein FH972_024235 [Carpinus fangiana]|uniref:GPI2-domain-containing protein n=1 Tax=Carpinus fangiana TaxID=176857 RepID=A0A5N6KY63_9ROSI|nr:hypothetical protein FH972_024235 [Carpinus fangiana]
MTMRRAPHKNRNRSKRRDKGGWKKLLWVKQSYPDNYTDEETFLDHLQRNPRLRPYEFWPLVADSMVIVQQVCTMIIFVCCFSGIIQDRVSPVTVVSWGTLGTILGWVLWDIWVGQEEALKATVQVEAKPSEDTPPVGLGLQLAMTSMSTTNGSPQKHHSRQNSASSSRLGTLLDGKVAPADAKGAGPTYSYYPPFGVTASRFSPRNQQRLATLKSALLIYCALLGLSPILKSLTKSTASDSIWAMAFWLMCINVIFFDYGGGVGGTNFPASLSTNAALMASTVLASRLPSTTHVFSLTLFSIEVFGLFPIFRRYLRHFSFPGHVMVTVALVVGASAGTTLSMGSGGWKSGLAGVVLGCLLTSFAMGICSWWLIGLQRYKNEIHGPWDPARPIVRGT